MIHTWAWIAWLGAGLVTLTITRNPLYLLLVWLCVAFVWLALRVKHDTGQGNTQPLPVSPLRFGVFVTLLAAVFNALTSHFGETRLFAIPGRIPLLSGQVTVEGLVYGATNGLVLGGMFASFAVLNQALPVRALIRLIPRAFYPLAVVTSVAITYVPVTVRQLRQIREAQAVRGHHVHGLRDWLPLLMPLLVGGLEHALQLAEAMTARGFAGGFEQDMAVPDRKGWMGTWHRLWHARQQLALLTGVGMLAGGWLLRLAGRGDWAGLALLAGGGVLIGWGLWSAGRRVPRTSYHRQSWRAQDTFVLLSALLVLAVLWLPLPGLGSQAVWYNPYPRLTLPPFQALIGMSILGLLAPGIVVVYGGKDL